MINTPETSKENPEVGNIKMENPEVRKLTTYNPEVEVKYGEPEVHVLHALLF